MRGETGIIQTKAFIRIIPVNTADRYFHEATIAVDIAD